MHPPPSGLHSVRGVGRIRNRSTSVVWIQDQELRWAISIQKVDGSNNPAELMTKHASRDKVERYCESMGCHFADGRARKAAELHSLRRIRQLERQATSMKSVSEELFRGNSSCQPSQNAVQNLESRLAQLSHVYHHEIREGAG